MSKLLKLEELKARIRSSKVLIENYKETKDVGFVKKAIAMLLFREHGLENYQPLWISEGACDILGPDAKILMEYLSSARSRIFPAASGKIRKLGHDYADFTVEHVVDVSSMVNYLLESEVHGLEERIFNLGKTCPICIVSTKEDKMLMRHSRNNINDPWREYDKVGIKRQNIRSYCGPLSEF